jgi:hypothetical protein
MEVIIDGVRYIPADSIIGNNTAVKILKTLLAEYWGNRDWGDKELIEESKEIYVVVTDNVSDTDKKYRKTIYDLVTKIFEESRETK